jgi:hypothetical protein
MNRVHEKCAGVSFSENSSQVFTFFPEWTVNNINCYYLLFTAGLYPFIINVLLQN